MQERIQLALILLLFALAGTGDAQRDCDQRNGRKDDDHQ